MDAAGLVQRIQIARTEPSRRPSKISSGYPSSGHSPAPLDERPRGWVDDSPVARKEMRQPSRLAPAHGVRLPRQRERPGALPADLPGREVHVQDRGVLVGADVALVDAHAPERHGRVRPAEAARGVGDDLGGESRDGGGARGRIAPEHLPELRPAARVRSHEVLVERSLLPEHVEHGVEERDVRARPEREMKVGDVGRLCPARVGDDDRDVVGRGELAPSDALPRHGMAFGGVGAYQEETIGRVDVRVRARRPVGPERARVACDGRRHAEARVRVEVVGAEEALGQLGCDVILLGQELSRAVESDRIGAVIPDDLPETIGDEARGELPRDTRGLGIAAGAHVRVEQPVRRAEGRRQVDRLGAQVAQARRVIGVALDPPHHAVFHLDEKPAADAAVRTQRLAPAVHRLRHEPALGKSSGRRSAPERGRAAWSGACGPLSKTYLALLLLKRKT